MQNPGILSRCRGLCYADKLELNCQSFVLLVTAENDECSLDDGDDDRKTRQYESMLPREMKQQRGKHPDNDAYNEKSKHPLEFFFLTY